MAGVSLGTRVFVCDRSHHTWWCVCSGKYDMYWSLCERIRRGRHRYHNCLCVCVGVYARPIIVPVHLIKWNLIHTERNSERMMNMTDWKPKPFTTSPITGGIYDAYLANAVLLFFSF